MSITKAVKPGSISKSWIKSSNPPCLTLSLRNGDHFILPYSQILWIKYSESRNEAIITIRTSANQIDITGKGLSELVSLLSKFEVGTISEGSARAELIQQEMVGMIRITTEE